jgi:hypothetical protein
LSNNGFIKAGMAGSVAEPIKMPNMAKTKVPGCPENQGATRRNLTHKESVATVVSGWIMDDLSFSERCHIIATRSGIKIRRPLTDCRKPHDLEMLANRS